MMPHDLRILRLTSESPFRKLKRKEALCAVSILERAIQSPRVDTGIICSPQNGLKDKDFPTTRHNWYHHHVVHLPRQNTAERQ